MTETPNKIIPNSFQAPNFFVDECMSLLTGNEFKCLSFLARKTFGWQKRSDRISKSQIMAATGLANETVDKTMNTLVVFGLVLRISENNPQNTGTEWALQTDNNLVRFDLLQERQEKAASSQRQKTEKGRQKLAERRGGLSNNPGVGLLDNPHKSQLKPKKIWAHPRPRFLLKRRLKSALPISQQIARPLPS
jgi:phage replication O-like protein O